MVLSDELPWCLNQMAASGRVTKTLPHDGLSRISDHLRAHGTQAARSSSVRREPLHQQIPGTRNPLGSPARGRRLAREAIARHGRNDEVEGIGRSASVRRGIGERLDELELLNDRTGQPCDTMSGNASSCFERTCMKWMSSP